MPICFNEAVREKEGALKKAQEDRDELEQQLRENKRTMKELRKERDNLLNKAETSSAYASTVVTEEMDQMRTDVKGYMSRIIELEARGKSDKHQIISLQVRLDQVVAAKAAAEKALLVSEAQNAQLKYRVTELEQIIVENASVNGDGSNSNDAIGSSNRRVPAATPRTVDHSPTSVMASTTSLDSKDLESIRVVNKFLRQLADDLEFQAKLKKDTVQWAFVYWSGGDVSNIEHKAAEIKKCEVVRSIYPVLDSFEAVCIQSNIKIPLDHVAQGKAALDDEALIQTFGGAFCTTHNLLKKGKAGWLY